MDLLPYVATIHEPYERPRRNVRKGSIDRSWQSWLLEQFKERGFSCFASDGTLREQGPAKPSGRYEFIDAPHSSEQEMPWLRPSPCPYVGRVVGFVTWEWWTDELEDRAFLAESLLWTGRGCLARVDGRGELFEAIVEEDFALADFAHHNGFYDGDFFWNEPAYTEYVRGSLLRAVEALGLTPELFSGGTSHNPHRISQFVPRGRQTFASCWETFQRHAADKVRLWGYNIAGLKSAAYHELITD